MFAVSCALAGTDHAQDARDAVPDVAGVMPISIDGGEPRAPMRLRDALRQPYDDVEEGAKPYRLTVEERHRLREQLRGQPSFESSRKP
ncbi:hypothetical protein [Hydrogenophaga sp.]|uniref:hypothetical protein n=1 Tax=Hydrogenophaga sp. TaxID=1904254 RepID=UPI0025BD9069|nr:hypothetical protein [Hydrogenophaga sp.]